MLNESQLIEIGVSTLDLGLVKTVSLMDGKTVIVDKYSVKELIEVSNHWA